MKKALKVISLMLVAVLMVMSFAACSRNKDNTAPSSDTSKEAKTPAVKVIDVNLTDEEYAFGVDKNQPELLKRSTALLPKSKLTELSTQYAINISPAALPM